MSRSSKLSLCLKSPLPKTISAAPLSPHKMHIPCQSYSSVVVNDCKVLTLLLGKFKRHNAHAEFRKNLPIILYVEMKGLTESLISKACCILFYFFAGRKGD
jgi:hypothetical protein